MKHLLVLVACSILSACGGGGGGAASDHAAVATEMVKVTNLANKTNTVYNTAVGDINGDGLDDVVVGGWAYDSATAYVWVFLQNQDGTLTDHTSRLLPSDTTYGGQHVFVADLDNDGKNDILVPGFSDGSAMVPARSVIFWNNGTGFSKQELSEQVMAHGACLDDIDGDGKIDFLASGNNGESILYRNSGSRSFVADRVALHGHWFTSCSVIHQASGDINILFGNDKLQLAGFNNVIGVYDSVMNLRSYVGVPTSVTGEVINSSILDANNDGIKDFILAVSDIYPASPSRYVLVNNGNNQYTSGQQLDALGSDYYSLVTTVNGSPAVLLPSGNDSQLYVRTNGLMVAYKTTMFKDMAKTHQAQASTVYQNGNSGKIFVLQLLDDVFYTQKM